MHRSCGMTAGPDGTGYGQQGPLLHCNLRHKQMSMRGAVLPCMSYLLLQCLPFYACSTFGPMPVFALQCAGKPEGQRNPTCALR